jgi:ParB/RepB/Spo0J family partition protein
MKKVTLGISRHKINSDKSRGSLSAKTKQDQASPNPVIKVRLLDIDKIRPQKGGRKVDAETVAALMDSIGLVGLQHPISVFRLGGMVPGYRLVAGAHRLEACKKLGHRKILARVVSTADAQLVKPAENLHRADLRLLDKYDEILNYEEGRKHVKPKFGAQPHDLGLSRTARELRYDRRTIREARATRSAEVKLVSRRDPKSSEWVEWYPK